MVMFFLMLIVVYEDVGVDEVGGYQYFVDRFVECFMFFVLLLWEILDVVGELLCVLVVLVWIVIVL